MSAFARAAAALHRDANLSLPARWVAGWRRDAARTLSLDAEAGRAVLTAEPQPVRAIPTQEDLGAGGGEFGAQVTGLRIDVEVAAVPVARREDLIELSGLGYRVDVASLDLEGVTWRLTLVEA